MAKLSAFEALRDRDFRMYFVGQICSISGNNAQTVAAGWLVLELTNNPTFLGVIVAAQYLPLLIAAPLFGPIIDHFPKRTILLTTQIAASCIAVALWMLSTTQSITAISILLLTFGLGLVNALDNPTRQALIREVVGPELLPNAIALNNVLMGVARIAGPAAAGVIIAVAGIPACFAFNALSFSVIVVALLMMNSGRARSSAAPGDRSFRSGLRYVRKTRDVRDALIAMALVSTFTYEFWVTLPVLVRETFAKGTASYATMMTVMSIGSVAGGLLVAHHKVVSTHRRMMLTGAFGLTTAAVGGSPTFWVALVSVLFMGAAYSAFVAVSSAALQLNTDDAYRGRVMGLWTSAYMGSTAIGGPLMGWFANLWGPRSALVIGGAVAITTAIWIAYDSHTKTKATPERTTAWPSTRS